MHLSLKGRARVASSEVAVEALKQENGIEILFAKLDESFLQDKGGSHQFNAFKSFITSEKVMQRVAMNTLANLSMYILN